MKIKNWRDFQHFKDRRPPWIKLHRHILDHRDINMISDCSFRVLVGLWLLASEDKNMEGNLPSIEDIAFRLRVDISIINKALEELEPFLEHDDITPISDRHQVDVPEESRGEDITSNELDFTEFWKVYPRKEAKKKSEQAWNRLSKEKKEKALHDIKTRYQHTNPQFIPLATTYINGERWNDTPPDNDKNEGYGLGAI